MRVALYARVSSEKQDTDLSLSAQLKSLREYAARNGHEVVREFVDEAESGRSIDRPGFKQMIATARQKPAPFEAILVWKLSRFARNREDSIIYKSLLRKQGIQVISINEPVEDTPSGRLLEGIIEVIDEFYSANLGQDVTRGMRENASRGFFNGSRVPFGFVGAKVKDGQMLRTTLTPDLEKAPIIRRIFTECAGGKGIKEIVKGLNRDGVPAPNGRRWAISSVHRLLTSEAYIGRLVWGKRGRITSATQTPVRVDNAWPAIVDPDLFDQVQHLLKERAPKMIPPATVSSRYLLSGLVRCGRCGASVIGQAAKSGRFHYYVCGTAYRQGKEGCPAQMVPKNYLEQFVVDRIKSYILTDEHLKELVELVNGELSASGRYFRERLSGLEAQINHWQARLERLYESLELGAFHPDELAPRIREVRSKTEMLSRAKAEVEEAMHTHRAQELDAATVLEYVKDLRHLLDESPIMEQKTFLKSFVQSIELDGAEVTVNYTVPLPPDKATRETVQVLDFIPHGEPKITFSHSVGDSHSPSACISLESILFCLSDCTCSRFGWQVTRIDFKSSEG
jgi:DNA invertase Pin-like site-specific DNA recombinase